MLVAIAFDGAPDGTGTIADRLAQTHEPVEVLHTLSGTNPGAAFGWAVSELGDVDGDSKTDLIVGEPFTATFKVATYAGLLLALAGGAGGVAIAAVFAPAVLGFFVSPDGPQPVSTAPDWRVLAGSTALATVSRTPVLGATGVREFKVILAVDGEKPVGFGHAGFGGLAPRPRVVRLLVADLTIDGRTQAERQLEARTGEQVTMEGDLALWEEQQAAVREPLSQLQMAYAREAAEHF